MSEYDPWESGELFSFDKLNDQIGGAIREIMPGAGIRVASHGTTVTLSVGSGGEGETVAGTTIHNFRINGSTGVETKKDKNDNFVQWTYKVSLADLKTAPGYDGWTVSSETVYDGYNWMERANTGLNETRIQDNTQSQRQGNAVNHASVDYPATWQMHPLQDNTDHPGVFKTFLDIATQLSVTEVWLLPFQGEDGSCP
jgi:hypothetical protein